MSISSYREEIENIDQQTRDAIARIEFEATINARASFELMYPGCLFRAAEGCVLIPADNKCLRAVVFWSRSQSELQVRLYDSRQEHAPARHCFPIPVFLNQINNGLIVPIDQLV